VSLTLPMVTTETIPPRETFLNEVPDVGPSILRMFEAWSDARRGHAVPRRKDFDPLAVPDLLKFVWIYRMDPAIGDYVCDLAGEEVHDAWGGSIKGKHLRAIIGDTNHRIVRERWDRIRDVPMVLYGAAADDPAASSSRFVERLVMPLSDAAGHVTSIIGVSLYNPTFSRRDYTPTVASHVTFIAVDAFAG